MSRNLTEEAAQGWQFMVSAVDAAPAEEPASDKACPYLNTSPSAMAWHLGRHLAIEGFSKPGAETFEVLTSRGDTFKLGNQPSARRFAWRADNTFRELA